MSDVHSPAPADGAIEAPSTGFELHFLIELERSAGKVLVVGKGPVDGPRQPKYVTKCVVGKPTTLISDNFVYDDEMYERELNPNRASAGVTITNKWDRYRIAPSDPSRAMEGSSGHRVLDPNAFDVLYDDAAKTITVTERRVSAPETPDC